MPSKLCSHDEILLKVRDWQADGQKVVFTNGCFDILHAGHVRYLSAARGLGDRLVVGLNSDASVRRLKGPKRPVAPEDDRAEVLAALAAIDAVTFFDWLAAARHSGQRGRLAGREDRRRGGCPGTWRLRADRSSARRPFDNRHH
jgi:cytidyltransferase-like protein